MFGSSAKKIDFPSHTWLLQKQEETLFTPDVVYLEHQEAVNLFVCCEMQRNMPRAELVYSGGVYLREGFTSCNFSTYKRSVGKASQQIPLAPDYRLSAPIWADQRKGGPARIKGELWSMLPYQLFELDRYKKNTVQFIRIRTNVDLVTRHLKV